MNNPKNPDNKPGKEGYDPRNPDYDPDHSETKVKKGELPDDADPSNKKSVDAPRHGGEAASKAPPDADPDARRDPSNPHPRDKKDNDNRDVKPGEEADLSKGETDPEYQPGGKNYVPPQPGPEDASPPSPEDGTEFQPPRKQAPSAGEVRQREHDVDPDLGKDAVQPGAKAKGEGRDK